MKVSLISTFAESSALKSRPPTSFIPLALTKNSSLTMNSLVFLLLGPARVA